MCTHSVAGALPIGVLITSDERENTLKQGFAMLRQCLPEKGFNGRGRETGPQLILTDNCKEERAALQFVWPSAKLLLCTFHMLQQTWRWIMDRSHRISDCDKPYIFMLFKKALYSNNETSFAAKYHDLLQDDTVGKYENAVAYFKSLYEERGDFALCFRSEIFTRGNQTNNFVEAQFLVLKDTILNRIKEYNVVALLEKITMDMEQHYKEKLLSVSDGSYDCNLRSRFSGKASSKNDRLGFRVPTEEEQRRLTSSIKEFPNDVFEVDSLSETGQRYTVDMVLGCCSCDQGKDGSPCKHQYVLWASNISNNVNFIPVSSPLLRQKLAYIALGKSLPLQHYTTLRNKVSSAEPQPNNTEYLLPVREEPQPMETTVAERFEDEASVTHSGSGTQLVQEPLQPWTMHTM
ncbi:hypothetical protein WMY93_009887 [Mugilogobius chulae]|uniref:SWIM-type domain-containing protein n=1 Tax=Mugilogobius chulae TaxID=88201 RepID=A0AAW0PI46_9GOBI